MKSPETYATSRENDPGWMTKLVKSIEKIWEGIAIVAAQRQSQSRPDSLSQVSLPKFQATVISASSDGFANAIKIK